LGRNVRVDLRSRSAFLLGAGSREGRASARGRPFGIERGRQMTLVRDRVEGGYGTNNEPMIRFRYLAPFEVDGITYTPPWMRCRANEPGAGGEGPMFLIRVDLPEACGGWHWRPPCPTAQALSIGWPSPVDGIVKDGVPSRHTP
jgi:hypothetical protein